MHLNYEPTFITFYIRKFIAFSFRIATKHKTSSYIDDKVAGKSERKVEKDKFITISKIL